MTELIHNQLRDALEHIIKTVGQSRTQTRRLRWIGKRAELALEGRPYVAAEHELPPDGETEYGKLLVRNGRLRAERDALQLLLNDRDDLDDQLTTLEQRRYAEQQAREAAERRVEELAGLLRQSDDFMYIMTGNDTQRDLDAKYGRLLWEDAIVNLRGIIATALNPTAEATSDEQ